MITLYALAYRVPKYFKQSIDSIIKNASEPLELIITNNWSERSEEIVDYAKTLVDSGKVSMVIDMANNPKIRSFNFMYENYPPQRSESFFMMTELDLVVPDGLDWIAETRKMQRLGHLTGFPLDLSNYVPPNGGHNDTDPLFGIWLMGLKSEHFKREYDRLLRPKKLPLSDSWIRSRFFTKGWRVVRSPNRIYHLTWDLHKETDPDMKAYWTEKLTGVNWKDTPDPIVKEVYVRKSKTKS